MAGLSAAQTQHSAADPHSSLESFQANGSASRLSVGAGAGLGMRNPNLHVSPSHASDKRQQEQQQPQPQQQRPQGVFVFTSAPSAPNIVRLAAATETHRTPLLPQQALRPLNGHASYRQVLTSSSSLPDGALLTRGGFVLAECDIDSSLDVHSTATPPPSASASLLAHSQTFGDRLELPGAAGAPPGPAPAPAADRTQYYRSQTTPAAQQFFPVPAPAEASQSLADNELRAVLVENMALKQKLSSLEHENLFLLEKLQALTSQFSAVQSDLERLRRCYPEPGADASNRQPSQQQQQQADAIHASALAMSSQANQPTQNTASAAQSLLFMSQPPTYPYARSITRYASSTQIEQSRSAVVSTSRVPQAESGNDQQSHRHTLHLESPRLEGGSTDPDAAASLAFFASPLGSRTPDLSRMRATSSSPLHRGASLRGVSSPPPVLRPTTPTPTPATAATSDPMSSSTPAPLIVSQTPQPAESSLAGPPAAAATGLGSPLSRLRNNKPFAEWSAEQVAAWLEGIGLEAYAPEYKLLAAKQQAHGGSGGGAGGGSGQTLLDACNADTVHKLLDFTHPLHRRKLQLWTRLIAQGKLEAPFPVAHVSVEGCGSLIARWDAAVVALWLEHCGLHQYKAAFGEARVDGLVLCSLSPRELLQQLGMANELHQASFRRALQLAHALSFVAERILERPSPRDAPLLLDALITPCPGAVCMWSADRIARWLAAIDLAEYAAHVRASGVHGALLVLEPRFTPELLADLLAIPPAKTLLRRHLRTQLAALLGHRVMSHKRLHYDLWLSNATTASPTAADGEGKGKGGKTLSLHRAPSEKTASSQKLQKAGLVASDGSSLSNSSIDSAGRSAASGTPPRAFLTPLTLSGRVKPPKEGAFKSSSLFRHGSFLGLSFKSSKQSSALPSDLWSSALCASLFDVDLYPSEEGSSCNNSSEQKAPRERFLRWLLTIGFSSQLLQLCSPNALPLLSPASGPLANSSAHQQPTADAAAALACSCGRRASRSPVLPRALMSGAGGGARWSMSPSRAVDLPADEAPFIDTASDADSALGKRSPASASLPSAAAGDPSSMSPTSAAAPAPVSRATWSAEKLHALPATYV